MGDAATASDAAAGSKIFVGGLDRTVDEGAFDARAIATWGGVDHGRSIACDDGCVGASPELMISVCARTDDANDGLDDAQAWCGIFSRSLARWSRCVRVARTARAATVASWT